jgi:hypothetical protein
MDKDLKKILDALRKQGFTIEVTTKQHVMVYMGEALVATFSGTSSDWRAMKNGISEARRHGFQWPPRR